MGLLLAGCQQAPRSSGLGLHTHWDYPVTPNEWVAAPVAEADRISDFALVDELQVPLLRDAVMNWGRIQPGQGGSYDFSLADDYMSRAQGGKAEVLALCWGIPRWAAVGPGTSAIDPGVPARQHADAFVAFVEAFVRRYDGDGVGDMRGLKRPIHCYEFMNEMEEVPTSDYAYWLKLFYYTVKSVDSEAVVSLGGLRSPGVKLVDLPGGDYPTYLERLLAEPELNGPRYPFFDVVAFRCYPARYPGRSAFDDQLAYIRQTLASRNLELPVWLTEYGFDSGTKEEARQAENIIKWGLRGRALGIERMYLHCLRDYHLPGHADVGQNHGLVREVADGQPPPRKPAFVAYKKLLGEISDRPTTTFRGDSLYVLTGKGDPKYVVWKADTYDPSDILIPGWWEIEALSGAKYVRQGAAVRLTAEPMFMMRTTSPFIN